MPRKAKNPENLAGHSHGRAGAAADRRGSMIKVVRDPVPQPSLNQLLGKVNPMTGESWLPPTTRLWHELEHFPTTENLQMAQWMLLARAVALDDAALTDPKTYASEARIRLAQFGVTPDELLKMRVAIVTAEEAERRGRAPSDGSQPQSSEQRYGALTRVK